MMALPKNVADAQIQQESGGKNGIVSRQGAVGVAQIRPANFPQYDAEKLKNDPEYALKARDEIMHDLLEKYKGNISLALAEYHAGPNIKQWGPRTFQYVNNILSKAGIGE
jgi:soluble lytic murein transglycosylase-like protein